ncbi:MAG: hypothetical protein EPN21_20755 [Methylococcaceae bacterium]|nr:MAG: hypothetical protein EPN21_20755 [Methylococcaceae bacterium]
MKINKLQKSITLMRLSPENSEEYWEFHKAAHYYELATFYKNNNANNHRARMTAIRAYKKGMTLKDKREAQK